MLKFDAAVLVILLFEQGHCQSTCNEATRFRCRDGLCLSKGLLCNGIRECKHGEDELKCGNVTRCPKLQRLVRLNNYYWNGMCEKRCITDDDCGEKKCVCDDECGFSCISPSTKCRSQLPGVEHMAGYNVYNKSLGHDRRSKYNRAPYRYGYFIHYKCQQGYKLEGPAPRCNGRGRWSREVPRCVPDFSECGQTGLTHNDLWRIYGGKDAVKGAWPWQVLIAKKGDSMEASLGSTMVVGGGSIISELLILTAAHVISRDNFHNFVVFVGISKLPGEHEMMDNSIEAYAIEDYFQHPQFSIKLIENDIALIQLGVQLDSDMKEMSGRDVGLTYKSHIRPVCLPCIGTCLKNMHLLDENGNSLITDKMSEEEKSLTEKNFLLNNHSEVVTTGFGHVNQSNISTYNIQPSKILQQASLKIEDETTCKNGIKIIKGKSRGYSYIAYTENMICCSSFYSGKVVDSCKKDSGGPLVRRIKYSVGQKNNVTKSCWTQIGIVSFGFGCGSGLPGYYTNVANYMPWINTITDWTLQDKKCRSSLPKIEHMSGYKMHRRSFVRGQQSKHDLILYLYESFIEYDCLSGYELEGLAPICNESGEWSESRPSCVAIKGCVSDPPTIPHMAKYNVFRTSESGNRIREYRAPYNYTAFVEYVCEAGYKLVGSAPKCNENGTWSEKMPNCVVKGCVSDPPTIPHMATYNVYRTSESGNRIREYRAPYNYTAYVKYGCEVGYKLIGSAPKCNENGRWSEEMPNCVVKGCVSDPPTIPHMAKYNVYRTSESGNQIPEYRAPYKYTAYVEYVCDFGYKLVGSAPKCNENGRWSEEIPSCSGVTQYKIAEKIRNFLPWVILFFFFPICCLSCKSAKDICSFVCVFLFCNCFIIIVGVIVAAATASFEYT